MEPSSSVADNYVMSHHAHAQAFFTANLKPCRSKALKAGTHVIYATYVVTDVPSCKLRLRHMLMLLRACMYLATCWKFTCLWCCRVMQQNQEYIPHVLAVFLGDSGMGHPDEVRSSTKRYDRKADTCFILLLLLLLLLLLPMYLLMQ